jgi:hypothetical protein
MNPWLTEADLGEIAVVARVLTDALFEHREKCSTCRDEGRYCTPIAEAIDEAVAWAERRTLSSKALTLRARELVARRELLLQNRREAA